MEPTELKKKAKNEQEAFEIAKSELERLPVYTKIFIVLVREKIDVHINSNDKIPNQIIPGWLIKFEKINNEWIHIETNEVNKSNPSSS